MKNKTEIKAIFFMRIVMIFVRKNTMNIGAEYYVFITKRKTLNAGAFILYDLSYIFLFFFKILVETGKKVLKVLMSNLINHGKNAGKNSQIKISILWFKYC